VKIAAPILNTKDLAMENPQRVTLPEATYKQLRHRPPEVEQGIARNIEMILINILYVNKYLSIKLQINQG
jgi:hypothetical protein